MAKRAQTSAYSVTIHGRQVKINGEEIPNVESVHFCESTEAVARTVIELGGEFDFDGLSTVEFVFHPTSIEEAMSAIRFQMQMDEEFAKSMRRRIVDALAAYRHDTIDDGALANIIISNMMESRE